MDDTARLERAELRTTVRVYRKEYLFDSRYVTEGEARVIALSKYGDRVQPEDILIRAEEIRMEPYELWVRLWNLKGEFKDEQAADKFAATLDPNGVEDVTVVDRNSREEHRLLSYGKVKLAT